MRRRLLAAGLVIACAITTLTGCGPTPAALPDGVSVKIYQPRTEIQSGRFAIQVTNGSDVPVTVVGAQLDSPDYSAPIVWEPHDVPPLPRHRDRSAGRPGAALLRRAELRSDARHPGLPARGRQRGPGDARGERPVQPVPAHPGRPLPRDPARPGRGGEHDPDRRRRSSRQPRPTRARGGPAGRRRDGHTRRRPVDDPRLAARRGWPAGARARRSVSSSPRPSPRPSSTFPIRPGRCDPHAIAEDKVGTLFPISVTVGGRTGTFRLPSTDEFRAQVYTFVQAYCA